MLTESITIPLEGEQAALFQGLDEREKRILAQLEPIRAERNAIVSGILAGKGLLRAVTETKGAELNVTPDGGITITVPPTPDISPAATVIENNTVTNDVIANG